MKNNRIMKGILCQAESNAFILASDGKRHLEDNHIWSGYVTHWLGNPVCARLLPQEDYQTGEQIVIMWPNTSPSKTPYVELYYNERLVKYWASTFGHIAINVNGEIFNYSHLINENEAMTEEEYFYRPALGEFAPSPTSGRYEIMDNGWAYYDKFGRSFMRTIHVLHIEELDTEQLAVFYHRELDRIHRTPPNLKDPEKYAEFNFFNRSCTTIIRDGLVKYGFKKSGGLFPRDLFVSVAHILQKEKDLEVSIYKMPQLMVPEAPPSAMSPLMNVKNRFKVHRLKYQN